MTTRQQVLRLVESGMSYEDAAARLGIEAGLAYLVATGLPADGSDTLAASDRDRPGFLPTSTQHLANPRPAENPTRRPDILAWVAQRARSDTQMADAATRSKEAARSDAPSHQRGGGAPAAGSPAPRRTKKAPGGRRTAAPATRDDGRD